MRGSSRRGGISGPGNISENPISAVDRQDYDDEDEDEGDMWGDDKEEEAKEKLNLLQMASRRMSSPALMWSNFRRRSSLAISRVNINKLRGPSPTPPNSSESPKGGTKADISSGSERAADSMGDLDNTERGNGSPSNNNNSNLKRDVRKRRKDKGLSNHPANTTMEISSPNLSENNPFRSSASGHGAADGGVYVLDEGPLLLHEAAKANASDMTGASILDKSNDNYDDVTVASSGSMESSNTLDMSDRAHPGSTDLSQKSAEIDATIMEVMQTLNDNRTVMRGFEGGGGVHQIPIPGLEEC